jgi:hypothetical protein
MIVLAMYQTNHEAPYKKKIPIQRVPPVQKYTVTGSVYCRKTGKLLPLEGSKCYEQGWNNHASPEDLPAIDRLPFTVQKVLACIQVRALQRMSLDIKMCDRIVAAEVKISTRQVRRAIKVLAELGFIGRCWSRIEDKNKKFHTWRMIRAHWLGWLDRWESTENAKSFLFDYRPDSNRLKAARGEMVEPNSVRVMRTGKVPLKWLFTQEMMGVKPAWTTESDKLSIMAEKGHDLQVYDDFVSLRESYEMEEPWAVQLIGVRPNLEDGILY